MVQKKRFSDKILRDHAGVKIAVAEGALWWYPARRIAV